MFYSNTIFKGLEIKPAVITAIVGIVNFLATFGGLAFLFCFGRKIIMVSGNIAMSLTLIMLSIFAYMENTWGMIVSLMLFITFFEFSAGVIVWLYNAEIMRDKAVAIAASLNWTTSLVISITVPFILKATSAGTLFLIFAICTVLGTVFIVIFTKETLGKTQTEIDALFRSEPEADKED